MASKGTTIFAGIDLVEARQLSDLIANAISELENQCSQERKTVEIEEDVRQKNASKPVFAIASAATQLNACVRPPNVIVAEISMLVRRFSSRTIDE
jgi:hypothetical protein